MARPSVLAPHLAIDRHVHARPYATIILSGGYEEAGDRGRFRVSPGDVLFHQPFSSHCDRVGGRRVEILDLSLPVDGRDWAKWGRITDPDLLVRTAERDTADAVNLLLEDIDPVEDGCDDLPDRLATALLSAHPPAISGWAAANGTPRETLTRQFTRLYQIAPARFRVEARARRAWRMIIADRPATLADIAFTCGYADQAQLTREVHALTGRPPGGWRRLVASPSHLFKT